MPAARLPPGLYERLLSLALDAQKGDNAEARQLDLCRRVLDQLIATNAGLDGTDHLREPAALLTARFSSSTLAASPASARSSRPRAATFETYWEDGQFEDYDPARDAERFDDALAPGRAPPPHSLVQPAPSLPLGRTRRRERLESAQQSGQVH